MTNTVARWLVVLLAVLLLSQALSAKASGAATPRTMIEHVTGKPVRVDCKGRFDYAGMAFYEASTVWIHVSICVVLRDNPSAFSLGAALYVIGHEATHMLGIYDESEAACGGLRLVEPLARQFYNVTSKRDIKQLVAGARWIHSHEPAQYHRFC